MELKELTKKLCSLPGPSGAERAVLDCISEYLRPFADEVKTDVLGNLFAVKRCGVEGARTLLLDAHMDEVGLIVTGTEDGFLCFAALGGIDPRILPAREVMLLADEPLYGVIDVLPPHILEKDEMDKAIPMDKLRIDAGLTKEQAERLCPAGTPAVFLGGCEELGQELLCGKALDDRSCAAILVKAFEELSQRKLSVDLILMLSAQEEVGGRGAVVGAWASEADYAVVADVTHAKSPDAGDVTVELGKGAAIGIGPNMNTSLTKELIRICGEKDIPMQRAVCPGRSGTNAEEIQVSRLGVATVLISLPERYMHTPAEVVSLSDMESVWRLVVEFAAGLEG